MSRLDTFNLAVNLCLEFSTNKILNVKTVDHFESGQLNRMEKFEMNVAKMFAINGEMVGLMRHSYLLYDFSIDFNGSLIRLNVKQNWNILPLSK